MPDPRVLVLAIAAAALACGGAAPAPSPRPAVPRPRASAAAPIRPPARQGTLAPVTTCSALEGNGRLPDVLDPLLAGSSAHPVETWRAFGERPRWLWTTFLDPAVVPDDDAIDARLAAVAGRGELVREPRGGSVLHRATQHAAGIALAVEVARLANVIPETVVASLECTQAAADPAPTFEDLVASGRLPDWLPEHLRRALAGRRVSGVGRHDTSLALECAVELPDPDPALYDELAAFTRAVGWTRPPYAASDSLTAAGSVGPDRFLLIYPREPRAEWTLRLSRLLPAP